MLGCMVRKRVSIWLRQRCYLSGATVLCRRREVGKGDVEGKHANMGDMVRYLQGRVPLLLQDCIGDCRLAEDVSLRVLPLSRPYIPKFHGRNHYKTAWKGIQVIMNTFVVRQPCLIQVRRLEVDEVGQKIRIWWDTVERTASEVSRGESSTVDTSGEGWQGSSNEELWRKIGQRPDEKWIRNLIRDTKVKSRVVSGLFEFELDVNNEKIKRHTIDNVEMLDDGEKKMAAKHDSSLCAA
ncbi:Mco32p Ecym_6135 [Eremothecium cymbalariae DBVPG|uniref:Uncharacterized protein n=1 Tax=Eremothecium cymbalariae (strain CBS 270.75 / DBVPG 7215 / KCTC 17166 / NRRL Y-17582) TaxID=931890 RepID=G8JV47_ERECY|nr:hypothetical protein Ecym_6135 [Eremothecium cymbalariae DBVPG\